MKYKAVLFDFIGTTVREQKPNTVMNCFEKAFYDCGVPADMTLLRSKRGKDKLEMINAILDAKNLPRELGIAIYDSFKQNLEDSVGNFCEFEGARETFSFLRKGGVFVGLGTAMERDLFEKIFSHLNWNKEWFDYFRHFQRGWPQPATS